MPRHIHPDDGKVYACPHCDNVPVYRRVQDNTQFDRDKEYVCYGCNTGFDEPVERPSQMNKPRELDPTNLPTDVKELINQ